MKKFDFHGEKIEWQLIQQSFIEVFPELFFICFDLIFTCHNSF